MATEQAQWGGRREGAGRQPTWKSGTCKAVKLPVALVDEVLRYARQLDAGAAAVPERDWDLFERTIHEKAALTTRVQQLEKELEEQIASQQQRARDLERRSEQWRVQNLEAQAALSGALNEHRQNKRGIKVEAVKHALNALGGYQDFPARKPPAASPATAEERRRLTQLETQNQDLTQRLEVVDAARAQVEGELAAAREALATQKSEPAKGTAGASENDAAYKAVILLRAELERKDGIRAGDVRLAIAALTGSPDGAAAAAPPPAGKGQVIHLIDEKLAADRRVRHLESTLTCERKQLRALTLAEQRAQARIADARSVLLYAYQDRQRGVRKNITVAAVKSALLSLGLDVDREAEFGSMTPS